MSQLSSYFIQFLPYCLLIGLTWAIDGDLVRTVPVRDYPFVVSVSNRSTSKDFEYLHFCTGTIVHQKKILTAAHCLLDRTPNEIEIIAGSVRLDLGRKYYPESWITFDQWNPQHGNRPLKKNDIAIIKLHGDGIHGIHPVQLLLSNTIHHDERRFTIAGWGKTFNGNKAIVLRKGSVWYISNEECSQRGAELKGSEFIVPPNFFCTRVEPHVLLTCGDGGAPIVNKQRQLLGISVGTCPNLQGFLLDGDNFIRKRKMNAHLRIYDYIGFVQHA